VATRDKSPYHVLITHGFILDDQGKKMSKSLGNVISPSMIADGTQHGSSYPGYGVDCLRSWIFSTDYTTDVSVGPIILSMKELTIELTCFFPSSSQLTIIIIFHVSGKINDSLKKIRNTLRFVLGNLFDFTPTDLITYEKLSNVRFPSRASIRLPHCNNLLFF
jgi:isoleucyl-tRNA synthetase